MNRLISPRKRARRGFTLVEVLMSVAILAGLAAATGAAIGASTRSFHGNLAASDMLQHGRNAMMRMAAELRTGTAHWPTTAAKKTSFIAGATVTDTGVTFLDETGRQITYSYVAANKTLTLKVNAATAAVLARGVESFSVRLVPARSKESIKTGGFHDELSRVTITLTVKPSDKLADGDAPPLTLTQSITTRSRLWQ